jgi:hypothetical protein
MTREFYRNQSVESHVLDIESREVVIIADRSGEVSSSLHQTFLSVPRGRVKGGQECRGHEKFVRAVIQTREEGLDSDEV